MLICTVMKYFLYEVSIVVTSQLKRACYIFSLGVKLVMQAEIVPNCRWI